MHPKKILTAVILGGLLLLVTSFLFETIANMILPYNIFDVPGMRPMTDPVAVFFFLYPFILAFAAAILYDFLHPVLHGKTVRKGIIFGLLLFLVITIPNQFVIWSSMYYPAGFYLSAILNGIIGFPLLGIVDSVIWGKVGVEGLKKEAISI